MACRRNDLGGPWRRLKPESGEDGEVVALGGNCQTGDRGGQNIVQDSGTYGVKKEEYTRLKARPNATDRSHKIIEPPG
jgi:hypothetical protein